MNIGKAFTFAFEDKDWLKKIGIAGLVLLIPLIGQLTVSGWALEVTRRVINRDPETLPDWSAFGDYLVRGLKVFVIGLVYALPIILLSMCVNLPLSFFQDSSNETTVSMLVAASFFINCIVALFGFALAFVLPAALAKFAVTDEMGAAFRFGEVFGLLRAAPGAYLLALLGAIVASVVASLGLILCFIGVIFTLAWAYVIQSHLWGQAYNEATASQSGQVG